MKRKLAAAIAVAACLDVSAFAHRLDEYLQAAMISMERDRVQVSMRLIPGVAALPVVLASIDTDGDGFISDAESRAYAQRVSRDVSLTADGSVLQLRLISVDFPGLGEMKQGLGEIHIEFSAVVPAGGAKQKLVFRNHHQSHISVYLANCLVPRDRNIRVLAQNRNHDQSFYELDYAQTSGASEALPMTWWSAVRTSLGNFRGFASMFRLGMGHIAEGTDHLLFLLTLLLPAPLMTFGSRWIGFAGLRYSVTQILKVVTAFTVGHSITLASAGLGFVAVPNRPIEVLIAVSIFVSALHALRPLFPGREAAIAAFFGLIHGLAFATTLDQLGLGLWARMANLFAFNIGIETMQLIVVITTMPSVLMLSRTRAYRYFRIGGALFAGLASAGWIAERSLDLHSPVDLVVNAVAHRLPSNAALLFAVSVFCWSLHHRAAKEITEPFSAPPL